MKMGYQYTHVDISPHATHTLYGSPFSGYMGVGLVFPRALYALETLEVFRRGQAEGAVLVPGERGGGHGAGRHPRISPAVRPRRAGPFVSSRRVPWLPAAVRPEPEPHEAGW